MGEQAILITLGVIGFVVNVVVLAVGGVRALERSTAAINKTIAEHRHQVNGEFSAMRTEFGEVVSAIRQKVNDVELECFKTFVRRESFYELMRQIQEAFSARIDKLEAKLDRVIELRAEERREEDRRKT